MKPGLGAMIDKAHPLARDIHACWLMNEGNGLKIHDLTGNPNHIGDMINMENADWKEGKYGYALEFDGSNEQIEMQTRVLWPGDFTILMCIYKDPTDDITPCGQYPGGDGRFILWIDSSDRVNVRWGDTTDYGSLTVTDNKWWDIALRRAGNDFKVYVNTILDPGFTITSSDNPTSEKFVVGGSDAGSPSYYPWDGKFSHCYVWERALSQVEIGWLYRDPFCFFLTGHGIQPDIYKKEIDRVARRIPH